MRYELCYSFKRQLPMGKVGRLRIDELVWDEWNENHIGRHGVRPEEVEEAVFDRASSFMRTRREGAMRYLVSGLTECRQVRLHRARADQQQPGIRSDRS